jgi:para-aminobenzoate synthetase component 1
MEQTSFAIQDQSSFQLKALQWAAKFPYCCALSSNDFEGYPYAEYDFLLGVDATDFLSASPGNAFSTLKQFRAKHSNWIFGYMGYNLKNELAQLSSKNPEKTGFPELFFFAPRYVLYIKKGRLYINRNYPEAAEIFDIINAQIISTQPANQELQLQSRVSKADYIKQVELIKHHIFEGDVYELNYCRELYAENENLDAVSIFQQLNARTKAPFSAFFRNQSQYALCASPERFLKKQGKKLISQPIKGTAARGTNTKTDALLKSALSSSEKERAENVMIVDLVRNDLTKSAKTGTIKVEELFGIYSFPTVHQMISTVTAECTDDMDEIDMITHAFPMGSMTGAPKIRAMQIIDEVENTARGLFSGALGYFAPEAQFDFNVVIRSILFNADTKYLSIQSGGAITIDSNPEEEWKEMELKSEAMQSLFKQ